jgi:hypothetical protein
MEGRGLISSESGYGQEAGSSEHSSEIFGCLKSGEFRK